MTDIASIGLDEIRKKLSNHSSETTSDLPYKKKDITLRQAAVLVPFVWVNNEWHLLFIQRAIHEKDKHSGQVAFAGGKHEEDDTDLQFTALREAQEEVGIDPADVTILGKLAYHYSISDFEITPVVATIPWPYQLSLQASEVAAAFTMPLQWLANADNYKITEREFKGRSHPVVYFNEYEGFTLWGATARMTVSLLTLLQTP